MSEQNEVVIRKVHDGYLVELLDCPLAYTFSSQDEAERFIGPVWQRLDYVKDLHSQALRAENQRLELLPFAFGLGHGDEVVAEEHAGDARHLEQPAGQRRGCGGGFGIAEIGGTFAKHFPRIDLDSICFLPNRPQLMLIHDGQLMLFAYS